MKRLKKILNYKKPGFWIGLIAVIAVIIIGVKMLPNPTQVVSLTEAPDMNLSSEIFDQVVSGTLVIDQQTVKLSPEMTTEAVGLIQEIQVDNVELSKNRLENRESTNQIHFVYKGTEKNGRNYNLYFNFNKNFREVWLNNDVKPGLSYRVRTPELVKEFFERDFTVIKPTPKLTAVEEAWKERSRYLGNNSRVVNIISLLPLPEGFTYDGIELKTGRRPFEAIIHIKSDPGVFKGQLENWHQESFVENAIIIFSLVENVELVTFAFDANIKPSLFQQAPVNAAAYLGEGYFARTETLEGFQVVLQEIYDKVSVN